MERYETPESGISAQQANEAVKVQRSVVEDSIEWAKKENRIADTLKKNGYTTLYCVSETTGGTTRTVKILEHEKRCTLMVNGKTMHSTNDLDACINWGRSAGYIGKNDVVTRKTVPAARKAAPAATLKKPAPAQRKPAPIRETWVSSLTLSERFK